MEGLHTIFEDECNDYSELDYLELYEGFINITEESNNQCHYLIERMKQISVLFEKLILNNNNNNEYGMSFNELELFEERMDGLFYRYQKMKNLLKKGRLLREHKKEKEREKYIDMKFEEKLSSQDSPKFPTK